MTCECAVRILGPMRTSQDSRQRPSASAQAAAIMVSIVLAVLGGMHTVWAAGGSWPFDDREAMSKVVWGDSIETFPSPAATMLVVVLMAAAALGRHWPGGFLGPADAPVGVLGRNLDGGGRPFPASPRVRAGIDRVRCRERCMGAALFHAPVLHAWHALLRSRQARLPLGALGKRGFRRIVDGHGAQCVTAARTADRRV